MCWFASMQGKWFASMQGNGLQWSPYTSPPSPSYEKEEATALAVSGMQLQEAEGSCSSKDAAAGDWWAAALRQAIGWTGKVSCAHYVAEKDAGGCPRIPPVRHGPRWRQAVDDHKHGRAQPAGLQQQRG